MRERKSKRNPIRQNTNILNWIKGQENSIFISIGVFKKHQITKKKVNQVPALRNQQSYVPSVAV